MNRIKEHLEQRELPRMIQFLKDNTDGPMPTFRTDGGPVTVVHAVMGLGILLGSHIACLNLEPNAGEMASAGDFLSQFETAEELRDAIWGKDGVE